MRTLKFYREHEGISADGVSPRYCVEHCWPMLSATRSRTRCSIAAALLDRDASSSCSGMTLALPNEMGMGSNLFVRIRHVSF